MRKALAAVMLVPCTGCVVTQPIHPTLPSPFTSRYMPSPRATGQSVVHEAQTIDRMKDAWTRTVHWPFVRPKPTPTERGRAVEVPYFGHYGTCWHQWPDGWLPCPDGMCVPEILPGEPVPAGTIEPVAPGTEVAPEAPVPGAEGALDPEADTDLSEESPSDAAADPSAPPRPPFVPPSTLEPTPLPEGEQPEAEVPGAEAEPPTVPPQSQRRRKAPAGPRQARKTSTSGKRPALLASLLQNVTGEDAESVEVSEAPNSKAENAFATLQQQPSSGPQQQPSSEPQQRPSSEPQQIELPSVPTMFRNAGLPEPMATPDGEQDRKAFELWGLETARRPRVEIRGRSVREVPTQAALPATKLQPAAEETVDGLAGAISVFTSEPAQTKPAKVVSEPHEAVAAPAKTSSALSDWISTGSK